MAFHEKHNSQFNTLRNYMRLYMHQPSLNFEMETYQSGLVQAYGVGVAIAAHRLKKPECWGTLYWQFNDAWPGISWASMDYFGRWKPLQYFARNMYQDVAVFFKKVNNNVMMSVVNDKLYDVECLVTIKLLKVDGSVQFNETKRLHVKSNEAQQVYTYTVDFINSKGTQKDLVFYGEVIASKENIMRNTYYLGTYKDLKLKKAILKVKFNTGRNELVLSSDVLVKNIFIGLKEGKYLKVSDNYFDIIPGEEYSVTTETSLESIKDNLQFVSYRESYTNEPL
jgi:beta-mannosidase